MPDRECQFPSGLQDSQHLTNCIHRGWKEHDTKAADHSVERVDRKWQLMSRRDLKVRILEPEMVCLSSSGFHHLQYRIDPEHLALRPN